MFRALSQGRNGSEDRRAFCWVRGLRPPLFVPFLLESGQERTAGSNLLLSFFMPRWNLSIKSLYVMKVIFNGLLLGQGRAYPDFFQWKLYHTLCVNVFILTQLRPSGGGKCCPCATQDPAHTLCFLVALRGEFKTYLSGQPLQCEQSIL